MSEQSLAGKTAIVTGASSGIGESIARTLGTTGAHVVLVGRTVAAMEATAKAIEEAGGKAAVRSLDVRDVAAVRGLVDDAVRRDWSTRHLRQQRRPFVPGGHRRRRAGPVARDVRDQRALAAGRVAGGGARDARVSGGGAHRQHLVDRRPAARLRRVRCDQARRQLHQRHAARGAGRGHDPRDQRHAGSHRHQLRAQLRSGVRRRLREGSGLGRRGAQRRAPARGPARSDAAAAQADAGQPRRRGPSSALRGHTAYRREHRGHRRAPAPSS